MTPQERWREVDGDKTLKCTYPLTPDSHIVEVGGYLGEWTAHMFEKYGCRIDVYEPVPEFLANLFLRFHENPRVVLSAFALSDHDGEARINLNRDGSSLHGGATPSMEMVKVRDAAKEFLRPVDLVSLNCEGSEYEILPRLIETGRIQNIKFLQVQFHHLPGSDAARNAILEGLSKTHDVAFSYEYLWEGWKLK